ncbi:MAG: alpha-amylase family glycosyl hydrolase [Blautia sp.]
MNYNRNEKERTENIQAVPVYPDQPGVIKRGKGYEFTVCVDEGEEIELLLYEKGNTEPDFIVPVTEEKEVGNLRAVLVSGISMEKYEYNYRAGERIFQDPWACCLVGAEKFGDEKIKEDSNAIRCMFRKEHYNWKDKNFQPVPFSDSIFYKLHVRGFTKQKDSRVRKKGTFKGIEQKIPYLKELGITGLLLMPAYDFREISGKETGKERHHGKKIAQNQVNYWGYTGNACYFAPKASYSSTENPMREFCHMVDALHQAGLECMMEFYFDGSVSPSMMLEILRYWKQEYHIDGFHLIGQGISQEVLAKDPLLAKTKLMFSNVDENRIYNEQKPAFKNIAEYNEGFLYCMRHLLKSDENMIGEFQYRNRRVPKKSGVITYMADQDGFTMMDLVSYDEKHNEANGEENRDGMEYNCSWNCGVEGQSRKKTVRDLRMRQVKNAFLLLLFSQGTPLIYQGDEFGNSQSGNNNAWCQDNETGWVDWKAFRSNQGLFQFVKEAIRIRKEHKILHMEEELKGSDYKAFGYPDISYHSSMAWYAPCEAGYRHMGIMYCGDYAGEKGQMLFAAYNLYWTKYEFALPKLPKGASWSLLLGSGEEIILKKETVDEQPGKEEKEGKEQKKEKAEQAETTETTETTEKKDYVEIPPRTIALLIGKQDLE